MEDKSKELIAKEAALKVLKGECDELSGRISALRQEIAGLKARLKAGDIIRWQNGCHKRRGRIEGFVSGFMGHVDYIVIPIKKDGTDGVRIKVTDWGCSKIELDQQSA
jgi:uncharacterized small protein (DUF1192 family)